MRSLDCSGRGKGERGAKNAKQGEEVRDSIYKLTKKNSIHFNNRYEKGTI